VEAGFRRGVVEPVAFVELVHENGGGVTLFAPHVGVNVWVDRYDFNLKTDIGYRRAEHAGEATQENVVWTTQTQLFF
jgi:hypothetical protein